MNIYPPGTRIAGRYEIASRPLMGGMGIVYVCLDHEENRPVALKTFKPEFLPDRAARDRFLREGTTWVSLGRHPHIVRAYGVERIGDGREVYLVLELVAKEEGRADASLRSWLVPGRALPVEQALLFGLQIVRGMAHATASIPSFVHRDLKPENVLVGADRLSNADVNRLRVTDFGLVWALGVGEMLASVSEDEPLSEHPQLTRVGAVLGTSNYMAPEQWERTDVSLHADIYALGCILGEMLTGRILVRERTFRAFKQAHQEGRAREAVANAPAVVSEVVARCLSVEPGARYGSWEDVEEALATAYAGVAGHPAPEPEPVAVLSRAERVAAGWAYSLLGFSYIEIGKPETALGYFERVMIIGEAENNLQLRATGLTNLGLAYDHLGDARRATSCHEQALAMARESGNQYLEAGVLGNLSLAYGNLGDVRRAIEYQERSISISQQIGDRHGETGGLINLGSYYAILGDSGHAVKLYEEGLRIARAIGNLPWEGNALGSLGTLYSDLGDARRAIWYHERGLAIKREIGDRNGEAGELINLGTCYVNLGDLKRAIELYEKGLSISREVGNKRWEANVLGNLGIVYRLMGDVQQAIELCEQALAIHREIGDRRGEGNALGNLGIAYKDLGDARRAIGYYEQELAIDREIGDRQGEGAALSNLGSAYLQLGEARRAIGYYEQALTIEREIGNVMGVATVSFNMASLYAQQGELRRALPLAQEAARIFAQIGHAQHAQQAQQMVAQIQSALR